MTSASDAAPASAWVEKLRNVTSSRPLRCAAVVFDGYELLDLYGPLELIAGLAALHKRAVAKPVLIAPAGVTAVQPAGGPVTLVSPAEAADTPIDVLLIPGGLGTRALVDDAAFVGWLRKMSAAATVTLTVCTGSFLLAATGLLDGRRATSNKRRLQAVSERFPQVEWVPAARWVEDADVLSSSGVSAGIDLTVAFIGRLFGSKLAQRICTTAEYVCKLDGAEYDPFAECAREEREVVPMPVAATDGRVRVGLLLYDQFEMLDAFGPLEMFEMTNRILHRSETDAPNPNPSPNPTSNPNPAPNSTPTPTPTLTPTPTSTLTDTHTATHTPTLNPSFSLTTLSLDGPTVSSFNGPAFEADVDLFDGGEAARAAVADGFDVLLVPGGVGCLREVHRKDTLALVRALVPRCGRVLSVCTGSAILAAAGVLDGVRATSNKLSFDLMTLYGPRVEWVPSARWVADGRFITSSGVSAGMDMALAVVAELLGNPVALEVAAAAEYVWNDDPNDDPFAHTVPGSSIGRAATIRTQKTALALVMRSGLALGMDMRGLTARLV